MSRNFGLRLGSIGLLLASVGLSACHKSSPLAPTSTNAAPSQVALSIQGIAIEGAFSINVGQRLQMSAFVTKADGSREDVTASAKWTSANADVADVASGLITGKTGGDSMIDASYQGVSGKMALTVKGGGAGDGSGSGSGSNGGGSDPGNGGGNDGGNNPGGNPNDPSAPHVTGLAITGNGSIAVGASSPLTLTASLSNGTSQVVTGSGNWSSSNPGVATVSGSVVTGVSVGTATIHASYKTFGADFAVAVSSNGTIPPPPPPPVVTVIGLTVTGTVNLSKGASTQLTVIANMSDGTHVDVTAQAGWSSSNGLLASVSASGFVTALLPGVCDITATYQGVSAHVQIQVIAPVTLVSISITGAGTVKLLQSIQLAAIAHYSDGSTADVTNIADWGCDNSLLGSLLGKGLLRGLVVGIVNVNVSYGGANSSAPVQITL